VPSKSLRRLITRAVEGYRGARERARRRRSLWNLLLVPLGLAGWLGIWYGLFRLTWAVHMMIYPDHRLQEFWRKGVSFSSFVPSFLMVFAPMPGALGLGLMVANRVAWLIPPARRAFEREAVGYPEAGYAEATAVVRKVAAWALPPGLAIALFSAWALRAL